MQQIEVNDWSLGLQALLAGLSSGQEVILTEAERPVARLIKLASSEVAPDAERGARMAEILEQLAARNAFAEITDPSAWQREIRKDRPLLGRD